MLIYTKAEKIDLKSASDFDESWLQDRIADDPGILGLGDISLIERERVQGKAGRLDLLLSDVNQNRRYEVELMLGATDASHVIRTIEYWDIERRRYPAYEHVAVLVAEDVTSRFLNVLSLFSGSIPLIVIQLQAIGVDEKIVLSFVKVLDQTELRVDDEEIQATKQPADRQYWENRGSPATVALADDLLKLVNSKANRPYKLNYNRHFVGLTDGGRSRNIVAFYPRKKHIRVRVAIGEPTRWVERLDEAGFDCLARGGRLDVTLTAANLEENNELIELMIETAVAHYEG